MTTTPNSAPDRRTAHAAERSLASSCYPAAAHSPNEHPLAAGASFQKRAGGLQPVSVVVSQIMQRQMRARGES
jgi:hypothetical protein